MTLYDIKIGKKIRTFKDLHTQHINVLKFSNFSPSLFATSSFDGDVKMWDLREGAKKPLFTRRRYFCMCLSPVWAVHTHTVRKHALVRTRARAHTHTQNTHTHTHTHKHTHTHTHK